MTRLRRLVCSYLGHAWVAERGDRDDFLFCKMCGKRGR